MATTEMCAVAFDSLAGIFDGRDEFDDGKYSAALLQDS
jgi:hypothetical protein